MIFYIRRQGNGTKEPPDAQHFDNFTERKSYCKHHVWQPKKLQAKAIRTPKGKNPRHRRDGNRSGRIAGQERPKTRPVRRISFLSFFQKNVRHLISFRNIGTARVRVFSFSGAVFQKFSSTRSLFIGADGPAEIIRITSFYLHFSDHIAAFIEAGECYRIVCPVYYKEECI